MKALDLFSGMGGWSLGLIQAGFEVVAGFDIMPEAAHTYMVNICSFPVNVHYTSLKYQKLLTEYFENFRGDYGQAGSGWIKDKNYRRVENFFFGDIMEISGKKIFNAINLEVGELDLIVGSPPCQGFSKANPKASCDDKRNILVFEFFKKIIEMKPKTFAMEEVPEILNCFKEWEIMDGLKKDNIQLELFES